MVPEKKKRKLLEDLYLLLSGAINTKTEVESYQV